MYRCKMSFINILFKDIDTKLGNLEKRYLTLLF